ncbi:MAG TPA: hypothetical protein VEX18_02440 [Polyangiaceae bacterium]|nr:hypothetical protein [Polyangiaceae bacterium]
MSGPGDDEPAPRRGAVPPPPSPGEGPDSVHLPRMEPPPPSLEAMIQSRGGSARSESGSSWPLWVALLVVAAAVTGYVMR